MASHDGHRDRMRERIERHGLESLRPHEVLEYLLYAFVPRKDTNQIAHDLIDEFGSFAGVVESDVSRLESVKGVTHNAAVFLHSLSALAEIYETSHNRERPELKTTLKCVDYAKKYFKGKRKEEVRLLLKDGGGKLVYNALISKGTYTEAQVYAREVADLALKHGAVSIVMLHNHPSGTAQPSDRDRQFTEKLAIALNLLSIRFDDHIILTDNDYYSFRTNGDLDKIANSTVLLVNGKIRDIEY